MTFEREYRDLAFVPRWSIIRTIKQQSVAEHSFYVALYAEQLARLLNWEGNYAALLSSALLHDIEESFTGDMPGPAKSHFVDKRKHDEFVFNELGKRFNLYQYTVTFDEQEQIKALIKMADGIEEMMFLAGEYQLGNRAIVDLITARSNLLLDKFIEYLPKYFNEKSPQAFYMTRVGTMIGKERDGNSKVVYPNVAS